MNAAVLLFFLATSPARAADSAVLVEDVVASVNGRAIMLSEYRKEEAASIAYLRRTNPAALSDPAAMLKLRERTLEELITRELLVQKGKRTGLTVSEHDIDDAVQEIKDRFKDELPEDSAADDDTRAAQAEDAFRARLAADGVDYAEFRQGLTGDIMARKVIARDVTDRVLPPTEEETRAYFETIRTYLASNSTAVPAGVDLEDGASLRDAAAELKTRSAEAARVERILIRVPSPANEASLKRALKTALALKARLDAGEDFAKIARRESEDPDSAPRGGDIGWVARGTSSLRLEKAVFSLAVGKTSEPIFSGSGYDVIRVIERRTAKPLDYETFKKDLATYLDGRAQAKKLCPTLATLREAAVIERHISGVALND